MKSLATLALVATCALAAPAHDHAPVPGPTGGKILEVSTGHLEFFVNPKRIVEVRFFDGAMKPVSLPQAMVSFVYEVGKEKVTSEGEATAFGVSSRKPLPAGDDFTVVTRLRTSSGAKFETLRVRYQAALCGKCKRAEYACICTEHAH